MLYRVSHSVLAIALALAGVASAAASAPTLSLRCGAPRVEVVTCRLMGRGFRAGEHLTLTYRVEFTALRRRGGRYPTRIFHRTARANARGAFTRPPLRFAVVKYHESYRVTVTVAGDAGDRARVVSVGIAQ